MTHCYIRLPYFNIYAPSTVDDAEEDRRRKSSFWEDVADLLLNHPNSSHLMLLGDCNARPRPHDRSNSTARRQTILDVERDNALCLMELLEGHGLEMPQTFQESTL